MHHSIGLVIKAEESAFTKNAGISHQQFLILMTIESSEPPVTETDIAKQLLHNLNSISMILDRMEKQKLVTKERSKIDRRVVYVKATAKGKRKLAAGLKVGGVLAERFSSGFTDSEARAGMKMLEKLRAQAMRELGMEGRGKKASIMRIVQTIKKAEEKSAAGKKTSAAYSGEPATEATAEQGA
jgi:DNA-binding MarR family transcriptional regulator